MRVSQPAAEACVILVTTAVLTVAVWRCGSALEGTRIGDADNYFQGCRALPLALIGLTAAAMSAERLAAASLGRMYRLRQAASSGIALGALALPWAFAGLAVKQQLEQQQGQPVGLPPPAASVLHSCMAASAAAVAMLAWQGLRANLVPPVPLNGSEVHAVQLTSSPKQIGSHLQSSSSSSTRRQRTLDASSQQSQQATRDTPPHWLIVQPGYVAAVAAAVAASSVLRSDCGYLAGLLVAAAATCGCLQSLLSLLPGVFTAGEALVAAQAAALLASTALQQLLLSPLPGAKAEQLEQPAAAAAGPYQRFVLLLTAGSLLAAAAIIPLLLRCQQGKKPAQQRLGGSSSSSSSGRRLPAAAAAVAAMAVAAVAMVAAVPAALWAILFAISSQRRLLLCCWWALDMAATLPAMHWLASSGWVPGILVRKGYHLLAVSLFMPALLLEPQLLGVALAAAFALLLALEVVRLSGLPAIAPRIHAFMTRFTDGRDSGLLLITHFTLLLGMAAPIWLSNALHAGSTGAAAAPDSQQQQQQPGQQQATVWLAAYAGIMVVGFGDTAASAVGSQVGRHNICRGCNKTVEGTAAAVGATLAAWWLLAAALPPPSSSSDSGAMAGRLQLGGWGQLAAATTLSCLLEAVTAQLDNIFVPLHYFALLCLL